MLDVAVYDIQWSKIQISASLNGVVYLANGGTARSRGVEFTSLWMPTAGLRLGLNAAYTDAVITEDVASLGGVDGDRLPNIPKWSLVGHGRLFVPGRARTGPAASAAASVTSDHRSASSTAARLSLPQDSYTALDLNGDVSNDKWTFRVFAKNLTDKRVYTNLSALTNAGTGEIDRVNGVPLEPRTVGVGFDYKF